MFFKRLMLTFPFHFFLKQLTLDCEGQIPLSQTICSLDLEQVATIGTWRQEQLECLQGS